MDHTIQIMKPPNKPCSKCGDEMIETTECMLCATCHIEEPLPPLIVRPDCSQCKGSGEVPYVGFGDASTMECYECRNEMPGLGRESNLISD